MAQLEAAGVALVWTPTPEIVYPPRYQTTIQVKAVSALLEGAARPGHFSGVATVVAKLFNVFQPTRAYFGQKDAQQVLVIRQMVRDLNFNLEIVVCPTMREVDGLAMSSRNARLSHVARQQATCLYRALTAVVKAVHQSEKDANKLRQMMTDIVSQEPLAQIDYVSVADPETLVELTAVDKQALVSLAVYIDDVRLIDNMFINGRAKPD